MMYYDPGRNRSVSEEIESRSIEFLNFHKINKENIIFYSCNYRISSYDSYKIVYRLVYYFIFFYKT